MSTTPLLSVDHVAFRVSDIDAALQLLPVPYENVSRTDTRAVVRYLNITVAFVLGDRHPNHIAFENPAAHARLLGYPNIGAELESIEAKNAGVPVSEYSDGARAIVVSLPPENSFAVEHLTQFPNEQS